MQPSPLFPINSSNTQGMKLSLELIIASLADQSSLRYFVLREDISCAEQDPDSQVLEILDSPELGIPAIARKNCFVHSTSWRYEPHQTVVLTYLVYTDLSVFHNNAGKLLSLHDASLAISDDPARPRPKNIEEEHVVAHGIRHFSHLVTHGNEHLLGILTPESIKSFQEIHGQLAGRLC